MCLKFKKHLVSTLTFLVILDDLVNKYEETFWGYLMHTKALSAKFLFSVIDVTSNV